MSTKHKLAIIGFGGMGGWHARNITEKVQEIEVVGAWDVSPEALAKAEEMGIKAYKSQKELLADDSIDIVTIATPNDFHKQIAIDAMNAGKGVVCEKPVTLNAAELEEIMYVAEKTGKLFSVHQNRRWDKDYLIIKNIIESGEIGKPYFIESRVQGSRRSMHGWRGHKLNGGGMVLDWCVHLLDQLMMMIDSPVVSVTAHLFYLYSDEVDDNDKIMIRFENGISAVIEMSTNCLINHPRWHITCTDGTAVVENWACEGRIMQLRTDSAMEWADDIVYTEAGPTRTMAPRPKHTMEELPLPQVSSDWSEYYKNIAAVMDGKEELIVKPAECLRVMKVIDAVFESQEKGCSISCRI
jgi:scyllo-inositol 2-dehydrogenase (NADP+)